MLIEQLIDELLLRAVQMEDAANRNHVPADSNLGPRKVANLHFITATTLDTVLRSDGRKAAIEWAHARNVKFASILK